MPKDRTTLSKNNRATFLADSVLSPIQHGISLVNLENLSTQTKTALQL